MDSRSRRSFFTPSASSSLSSSASSSSSTPLSSRRLYGRSSVLGHDGYSRLSSTKLEPDLQTPRFSSARDYSLSESRHSSSGSRDASWSSSSLGSRNKLGGSDRLGTYTGVLDEFKRPKLSYINGASYSRNLTSSTRSSAYSSLGGASDPTWKSPSGRSAASSSSCTSDSVWSRQDVNPRVELGLPSIGEHSRRMGSLSSSLYPERVASSYAQGARPKESFYSSRTSSSSRARRSAEYEAPAPLLSRESSRPAAPRSGQYRSQGRYTPPVAPPPSESTSRDLRGRGSEGAEPEGRCSTRQLLSRLASSMSSTLFSRRSSQDSSGSGSASRSFESSEDGSEGPRAESSPPSAGSSRNGSPDSSTLRSSDLPHGLGFLRRRRQATPQTQEPRQPEGDVDTPSSGSLWLSSSLRSRCPPLFSCRRREETPYRGSPFPLRRLASSEAKVTDEEEEEGVCEEKEPEEEPEGAGAAVAAATAPRLTRTRRLSGITPNSLFHLSVGPSRESSLPDNMMITVDIMAAGTAPEKEKPTPSRDPEKLRQIKESLLLEESDEEEGDLCRICQMGEDSSANPLIEPCRCTGSLQYVHQDCMKKWLRSKISSGSDLEAITTCELCKEKLHLNIENFDINELYHTHERSENEFISCGLYLVVLLHLCEQRFSDVLGAANDAGFFNLARTLHEYMDDLESSNGDSEEEDHRPDTRPSIDFCDLDDDDEEEEY